jgi:transposase
VRELLAQAGIGLMYLPRYSPEFNPIEHAWAKMKERLKAKAAALRRLNCSPILDRCLI